MCQGSAMLTKKQFWRRQGSLTNSKDAQDPVKQSFVEDSAQHVSSTNTSRSSSIDDMVNKGKSVVFSPYVRVILIPSIPDYKSANLDHLLWWNSKDYHGFKSDAVAEVRSFLDKHQGMDGREAIRHLYYSNHGDDDMAYEPTSA